MIKLNKQVDSLYNVIDKIEAKIEEIQSKMDAIEEKAGDEDRCLTRREQDRWFDLEAKLDEFIYERDEIERAIDFLKDFTEY